MQSCCSLYHQHVAMVFYRQQHGILEYCSVTPPISKQTLELNTEILYTVPDQNSLGTRECLKYFGIYSTFVSTIKHFCMLVEGMFLVYE
jgi:hypothetical protein